MKEDCNDDDDDEYIVEVKDQKRERFAAGLCCSRTAVWL